MTSRIVSKGLRRSVDAVTISNVTDDMTTTLPDVRVAHLSDTHIGYEAYPALSATGENQRSIDIARAFRECVAGINDWDPPLVVHSGDLAERPHLANRWMLYARAELEQLASIRADGTRRQVVVIAGNHDQPSQRRERCWLDLFTDVPGVHIVTGGVKRVTFDTSAADVPDELEHVDVVAVPHEALKTLGDVDANLLRARDGKLSILAAHGVAGGSGLFRRSIGREFPIPTDLMSAGWHYVALGHWHRRGPIDGALGSRAYYAGSSENMGFGDLSDNTNRRGWYQVVVSENLPAVTAVDVHNRPMLRQRIDVAGRTPDDITKHLVDHLDTLRHAGKLDSAVVGIVVEGVSRDIWNLVDTARIRDAGANAFHFELICRPARAADVDDTLEERNHGDLWDAISERSAVTVSDPQRRAAAVALAHELLAKELKIVDGDIPTDNNTADAAAVEPDGDATADTTTDTDDEQAA